MKIPDLSLEGYVRSHFKWPWERFEAMDPRVSDLSQEEVDARAATLVYHNIDLSLAASIFGIHAYHAGGYAATNTIHFYRVGRTMQFVGQAAAAVPVVAMLTAPMVAGFVGNTWVASQLPEHEQAPWWQSVAQALTGTGPGIGGADIGL